MTIALTEEHRSLAAVVDAFAVQHDLLGAVRSAYDGDQSKLDAARSDMADQGWLGLHVPEEYGGQGYGLPELIVLVERLGAVVAAGPVVPTTLVSAVLAAVGTGAQRKRWLPGLVDGSLRGAVSIARGITAQGTSLDGDAGLVTGAVGGSVVLVAVGADLVVIDTEWTGVTVEAAPEFDATGATGRVLLDRMEVPDEAWISNGRAVARRILWTLVGAESAGGARRCLDTAVAYAKQREQFGRTVGSFQAIKHLCANMLTDAEVATAAAWDAARATDTPDEADFTASVAGNIGCAAYVRAAERNIQVHGGIGYTWEHDAHLYLRRATAVRALIGAEHEAAEVLLGLARGGITRRMTVQLPPEAEQYRASARAVAVRVLQAPVDDRRHILVESGYFLPHWPQPWGRDAGAVEQLVIDEEFAGILREDLGITGWVALTLAQHGTPDQLERWILPTMEGELRWCQLFSEPGAGSDAAAISTRGIRTEGGWLVSGQKVWTSDAQNAQRGFATIRTTVGPSKHAGITMMSIDMKAEGVLVRPLRELTGDAMFNEVFFDSVFVPDSDVVGEVDQGWRIARATLSNERVTIGARKLENRSARRLIELADRCGQVDPSLLRGIADLLAEEQAIIALGLRQATRAIEGGDQGPEGNVSKLLAGEHTQRTAELGMRIAGPEAISGREDALLQLFLFSRCLTIAGGTSEVVRNQIAERILGLPREPMIG